MWQKVFLPAKTIFDRTVFSMVITGFYHLPAKNLPTLIPSPDFIAIVSKEALFRMSLSWINFNEHCMVYCGNFSSPCNIHTIQNNLFSQLSMTIYMKVFTQQPDYNTVVYSTNSIIMRWTRIVQIMGKISKYVSTLRSHISRTSWPNKPCECPAPLYSPLCMSAKNHSYLQIDMPRTMLTYV